MTSRKRVRFEGYEDEVAVGTKEFERRLAEAQERSKRQREKRERWGRFNESELGTIKKGLVRVAIWWDIIYRWPVWLYGLVGWILFLFPWLSFHSLWNAGHYILSPIELITGLWVFSYYVKREPQWIDGQWRLVKHERHAR